MPGLSPGKSGEVVRPKPKRLHVEAEPLRPEPEADLDGADVARLDDHVGERQHAVVVVVVDAARAGT